MDALYKPGRLWMRSAEISIETQKKNITKSNRLIFGIFVIVGGKHSRNTAPLNRPILINFDERQGHFRIKNSHTFFFRAVRNSARC